MHKVKILQTEFITHDVKRFIIEKPKGYSYTPGQATDIAIPTKELKSEKRPFTFTSLQEDPILEFIIKAYPEHNGVTEKLHRLTSGDSILIGDAWGAISYKGPGVYLAAGAGITPFIAIFRDLANQNKLSGNTLIFANKKWEDIILERELKHYFRDKVSFVLSREELRGYLYGHISKEILNTAGVQLDGQVYICGPGGFEKAMKELAESEGASPDSLVFEA